MTRTDHNLIPVGRNRPCRVMRATCRVMRVMLCAVVITSLCCGMSVNAAASSSPAPQSGERISDSLIDSTGDRVMGDGDFRSMRRRLEEPLPALDADKGFLRQLAGQTGELVTGALHAVADFFSWFFRSSPAQGRPTPQQPASSGSSFSFDGAGKLLMVLLIVAVLAVIVAMTAIAVKSRDRKRRHVSLLPNADEEDLRNLSVPPGELGVSVYEHRALQFAQQGNLRSAIRELLLGSMSWIERSGHIRFRRGLTNRDYLRSVWRHRPHRDAFGTIALAFEQIYYGRRQATPEMFTHSLTAFQGAFRDTETVNASL